MAEYNNQVDLHVKQGADYTAQVYWVDDYDTPVPVTKPTKMEVRTNDANRTLISPVASKSAVISTIRFLKKRGIYPDDRPGYAYLATVDSDGSHPVEAALAREDCRLRAGGGFCHFLF